MFRTGVESADGKATNESRKGYPWLRDESPRGDGSENESTTGRENVLSYLDLV